MGKFFDSEIIQEELEEINDLQQEIYGDAFKLMRMSSAEKVEHVENLVILLEKQKIMYTRLSLSDDPETDKMMKKIRQGIDDLGFPKNVDVNVVFRQMSDAIALMRDKIDKTSTDV